MPCLTLAQHACFTLANLLGNFPFFFWPLLPIGPTSCLLPVVEQLLQHSEWWTESIHAARAECSALNPDWRAHQLYKPVQFNEEAARCGSDVVMLCSNVLKASCMLRCIHRLHSTTIIPAGMRRFCQMMWRLNFLVTVTCVVLENSYMLYYICPMHTIFTVFVYACLALGAKYNSSATGIWLK